MKIKTDYLFFLLHYSLQYSHHGLNREKRDDRILLSFIWRLITIQYDTRRNKSRIAVGNDKSVTTGN